MNQKLNLEYAPESGMLRISSSAYPNGNRTTYENGMPVPRLLPSNHPDVLKMRLSRVQNVKRKPRTLLEEAGKIIEMKSKQLQRKVK